MPSCVAANESFKFSTNPAASLAPGRFSATSCSMRVQRTDTSANSMATKNAFMITSSGTANATIVSNRWWATLTPRRGGPRVPAPA